MEHGKLNIRFVGVHHTVEALAAHRKIIEAAIADADIVVLEAAVNASGALVTSGRAYETSMPVHGTAQSVTINMPKYDLETNSGVAFFSEAEHMARMHRKQIVTFDPATDRRLLQSEAAVRLQGGVSHAERLDQLNQQMRRYSEVVAKTGEAVALGSLVAGTIDAGRQRVKSMVERQEADPVYESRRSFLKRSFAYAAGAGLGVGVMEKAEKNKKVIDFEYDSDQERTTQYNETDFRDVSIATGLDRLSQVLNKEMKVAIIYGDYHRSGVRKYLESPELRETKLALYKPFRDIAPPEMTAYKYELDPDIASGKVALKDTPEQDWGVWRETMRAQL